MKPEKKIEQISNYDKHNSPTNLDTFILVSMQKQGQTVHKLQITIFLGNIYIYIYPISPPISIYLYSI